MDLKKHIRSIPDYPKKGILFRDITTLIKNAEAFKYTNNKIIEISKKIEFDKVAAIESRGFIFASTVSHVLEKPFILLRKKDKLPADTYSIDFELEYGKATIEVHKDSISKNEKVLIHGGASGIGTTAIQLAKHFGAKVYATAGSDEKCQVVEKLGAIKCFNYKTKEFEKEINQLTNKQGVDVILDMVAGPYISRNLKCLSINGRLVIIAVQGGIKDEVNFANIMIKRQTITGSTLRPQPSSKKAEYVNSLFKNAWEYLEKGKIKPIIQKEFLLSDASEAHKALEKGDHVGKFIMKVS